MPENKVIGMDWFYYGLAIGELSFWDSVLPREVKLT